MYLTERFGLKKLGCVAAPEGAIENATVAVCLKAYPDTNRGDVCASAGSEQASTADRLGARDPSTAWDRLAGDPTSLRTTE